MYDFTHISDGIRKMDMGWRRAQHGDAGSGGRWDYGGRCWAPTADKKSRDAPAFECRACTLQNPSDEPRKQKVY